MSQRLAENSRSGARAAVWGWLVWYFTPVSGFLFTGLGGDIYTTLDPENITAFIVGTAAALGLTGGVGAYYNDKTSPAVAQQPNVSAVEPRIEVPAPVVVSKPVEPVIAAPVARPVAVTKAYGVTLQGVTLGPTPLRRNSGNKFSKRSLSNRAELSPMMQKIATRALAYSPHDWVMTQAARTLAEQVLNVENGASKVLESMHVMSPAEAWDFYVFDESGKLLNGDLPEHEPYYRRTAQAIRDAAADEGASVVSGVLDWGWDYYHVERDRKEVPFKWPDGVGPDLALA